MNNDNKKQLTSQEWEIQRKEKNQAIWSNRKKRWAEWKKNNPEKAKAHALLKAKLNGKTPKSL
jgi:hypothetical protein